MKMERESATKRKKYTYVYSGSPWIEKYLNCVVTVTCDYSMYIQKDINVFIKKSKYFQRYFLYNMQGFPLNAMPLSENLINYNRNHILLKYKNNKNSMKYEYFVLINVKLCMPQCLQNLFCIIYQLNIYNQLNRIFSYKKFQKYHEN